MSKANGRIEVWVGDLMLPDNTVLNGLRIWHDSTDENISAPELTAASLTFLSFVDPNRIPLHLVAGPNLNVTSESQDTLKWLSAAFQCEASTLDAANYSQCAVAVLARTPASEAVNTSSRVPRITEVLFYAVGNGYSAESATDKIPGYDIFLLPLSSDLLYVPSAYPDQNPGGTEAEPQLWLAGAPTEKKERLGDLFDAASDRRKRSRRKGGESVSVAASRGTNAPQSQAFDGRAIKSEASDSDVKAPQQQHDRPSPTSKLQRVAPTTVSSSRPGSRANLRDANNGTLSQPSFQGSGFVDDSFEARNRQVISRTVLAGMRIYGLQPQRKQSERKLSMHTQSQVTDPGLDSQASTDARSKDAEDVESEYKAVYHQAYKGTAFAFRRQIGSMLISPDAVREVADKLLGLFCQESS